MNPADVLDVVRAIVDLARLVGVEDQLRDHLNEAARARVEAEVDAAEAAKFGPPKAP